MSEIISGYLKRDHFIKELEHKLTSHSRIPVPAGENQGYELGKALGYGDALREVIGMVRQLPDEPKPAPRKAWHHS